MNVRKTFYTKNFDDYVKSCKTFYLNTGKTVNFSLNHIRMATQFSGPKTFTWNICFSIELPFQNLLEVLIEEKLENFREFREGFTFDFRRKITLHRSALLADQGDQEHNETKALSKTEIFFHDNGQSCLKQTYLMCRM